MKKLELSNGNSKLGDDTIILNMGTAHECPSAKLGLCKLGKACYALKAEKLYPQCKPYRDRQAEYWQTTQAADICRDFDAWFKSHPIIAKRIRWFRFNESGDFYSQQCIDKLDTIAKHLRKTYKVRTYGYSARADLDFSKASFACKGSGHDKGNNGKTMAYKFDAHEKKAIKAKPHKPLPFQYNQDKFIVCPMDCKKCNICKTKNKVNVCFPLH
jgi:hypothetical protein